MSMLTGTWQLGVAAAAVLGLAFCPAIASELEPAATVSASTGDVLQPPDADAPLAPGRSRFVLSDWGGPDVPVWTYVPIGMEAAQLPIVIVMHGASRDADRYRNEWRALAQLDGFVIAAPEISKADFPKAAGYNLGNVFREEGVDPRPETSWSFSVIEPLFDTVVDILDSEQEGYTLYGHSAGSQFVHRFLFYKPEARAERYIAANAGWYTMPDFDVAYPYGLQGSGVEPAALDRALAKDVVILLGTLDNDPNHRSLRRAPEAMLQGPHRLARGKSFYATAQAAAEARGIPFNWQLATVPNAVHSNGQMVFGAVPFIVNSQMLATVEQPGTQ